MKLKCNNCEYKWPYKGDSEHYATCPRCLYKVNIKKNNLQENESTNNNSKN